MEKEAFRVTAIIYTSKHGTTAKVTQMIAGQLNQVLTIDLKKDKPQELYGYAVSRCFAGGEFLFEKMNFFERAIIKRIAKTDKSVSQIREEAIEEFVTEYER